MASAYHAVRYENDRCHEAGGDLSLIALVLVIPLVKRSLKPIPGVQADVGETFTVTLDSSADLALRWDLLATDATKVQLLDQPDAKEAIARTEVWTFCAIAPGKVTLYCGFIRFGYPNLVAVVPTQPR